MFKSLSTSTCRLLQFALIIFVLAGCGSAEDRAQGHYERGMKLVSQQDHARAAIEFRNAVRLKKDFVEAWRGLAQIEERNRNWSVLSSILRTVIELDARDIESRLRLGKLMMLGNSLDEALNLANAAAEIDDRNASVLAFKAAVLLRLNDHLAAARTARTALEIDPANSEAAIVLAAERLSRKDFDGALAIIDREPIADMKNLAVQLFKINIFEQMGDVQRVESQLRRLAEHYPDQAVFRQQLVRLYLNQKRPADAEKELRAVADANPADPEAGLNVVRLLGSLRGAAAAEAELLARIKAGEQHVRYQLALAELKVAQGQFAEAVKLLEGIVVAPRSQNDAVIAQVKLAEMYFGRREFDKVEALVSDVLRKDARNGNALKLRALLHQETGRLDAAIADLRQALNDQPRASDLMALLAGAYERSGAIELADRQLADALRVSNFDPAIGLNYVSFLRRRGNVSHAEDVLTELVRHHPNNVNVLSNLADVRLQRQNWAGAQQIADAIRRINADYGLISDQINSAALGGQKRFDESVTAMENAYNAAMPGAVQPMAALVSAYVRAQQTDRAVSFVQAVLKENPQNAEARVLLGSLQLMQNRPEEASKSFNAAIKDQPNNAVGYRALSDLHLRQGRGDDALAIIQAGLKQQPDNGTLRLALASVLEFKKDYEAAIAEYEALLKMQSGSMVVANNLASLLADHREDKASLERALSLAVGLRKTQVPHFKDTLGWVYYRQGDYKSALPLLEEAATELPKVALVRYHLGMTYLAVNQPAKASKEFNSALELAANDEDLSNKIRSGLKKAGS